MISFITSASSYKQYPEANSEVIFVGRSNVGKSSIINALYGKIAYVGKTPGKTKLLNFFNIGDNYMVCDAPGYGYAKRSDKEVLEFGRLMEEYFSKRSCLKLCVMILDVRRIPNTDDIDMKDFCLANNIPCLYVLNKVDKLSNNELSKQKNLIIKTLDISLEDVVLTSTLKKKNIDVLKKYIESYV